jgi:hypothetical protein
MQMTPDALDDDRVDATAVLPVWPVADDHSRCRGRSAPSPSIALRPVCSGSLTGARSTTPGADALDGHELLRRNRPLPSIRLAERVTTRPPIALAHRHRDDAARALDRVAFLDVVDWTQQHRADALFFQIERDAVQAVRELEHLAGHGAFDAVNARDAVAEEMTGADFGDVDVHGVVADVVADDLGNLFSFDLHGRCSFVLRNLGASGSIL